MTWPVLMAYTQNGLAVPYNGRWNSRELTQFVRALMNPMKRFTSPDELLTVMASNDAVVVAFVDLLVHRSFFSSFYRTAVKWIEKDPNQEIVFGVVTGDTMRRFGVESAPVVRMYLWNDTVVRWGFHFFLRRIENRFSLSAFLFFRRNTSTRRGLKRIYSGSFQRTSIKWALGCRRREQSPRPWHRTSNVDRLRYSLLLEFITLRQMTPIQW